MVADEIGRRGGVSRQTLRSRLKQGLPVEEAVKKPNRPTFTRQDRQNFFAELVVQQAAALKAAQGE